jgi:hypothetical protein
MSGCEAALPVVAALSLAPHTYTLLSSTPSDWSYAVAPESQIRLGGALSGHLTGTCNGTDPGSKFCQTRHVDFAVNNQSGK